MPASHKKGAIKAQDASGWVGFRANGMEPNGKLVVY
jgi:hypothetical protein